MTSTPRAATRYEIAVGHVSFLTRIGDREDVTASELFSYQEQTRRAVMAYVDSIDPRTRKGYLTLFDDLLDAANAENEFRRFDNVAGMQVSAFNQVRGIDPQQFFTHAPQRQF